MRRSDEPSDRQKEILDFIEDFVRENGYPPAIRDIQRGLKISSTSVVAYNLNALKDKGLLSRNGKVSRGIRLTSRGDAAPVRLSGRVGLVPLLGVITAGSPLPDPQEVDTEAAEKIEVPAEIIPPEKLANVFALRVRGQSMIDALIDDGDIVLLRHQEKAENGQMVAAWLIDENAVTLKKFYLEGDRVRLQPANSTMQPIYTSPENVRIQGRVVGVLRSLL